MRGPELIESARLAAGLTQDDLARRAHTSRTTLSAYERGRKSPTLSTAERLLAEAGHEFSLRTRIEWHRVPGPRGSFYCVPDALPSLSPAAALRTVVLPTHLRWSGPARAFRLVDRRDRARVYEIALREGDESDIEAYVDGALLVEGWDDLVLPRDLRVAWQSLVRQVLDEDTVR